MDEDSKRRWDVRLATFTPLLAVMGLLTGIWQFNEGAKNQRRAEHEARVAQSREEFHRKMWLDRIQTYRQVAELVGRIIATPAGAEREQAIRDYTTAYWGTMILVSDDPEVERTMIAFASALRDRKTDWRNPELLKSRADALLQACRRSIEVTRPPQF